MESSSTVGNYRELQLSIDKVVSRFGLERTKYLLDTFIQNTSITHNEHEKIKMITQYLIGIAIKAFELQEGLFFISTITEYRDARYCCFHLLRKYTADSYPKIGLGFQCSTRIVMYGCTITQDRLNFPKAHPKFLRNYGLLESKLIEFIAKID